VNSRSWTRRLGCGHGDTVFKCGTHTLVPSDKQASDGVVTSAVAKQHHTTRANEDRIAGHARTTVTAVMWRPSHRRAFEDIEDVDCFVLLIALFSGCFDDETVCFQFLDCIVRRLSADVKA